VAGERVKLVVQEREQLGSADSRRLRKQGLIPGVLYGRSQPHPISVRERELRAVLTTSAGLHAILDVVLEGQKSTHPSVLKEYQLDPIRGKLTHIDLQEVRLDQPIQASVTVNLIGESAGVKEGGVLSQVSREVNIEALPMEIPEHFDIDVSGMQMGDTLRLTELTVPDNVTLLDDPEETVLATVTMPTREEEPEEVAEEGEEGAELEGEAAEGEPAGEAGAAGEAGSAGEGEPGTTEG
jgi:large subunit ribosomal protein L25